jgi:hypothetical protein
MPAFVRGRLRALVLLILLVATLAALAASLLYFHSGPRPPAEADVVLVQSGRE